MYKWWVTSLSTFIKQGYSYFRLKEKWKKKKMKDLSNQFQIHRVDVRCALENFKSLPSLTYSVCDWLHTYNTNT